VKTKVVQNPARRTTNSTGRRSFNLRGGQPVRQVSSSKRNVWDLSNKDFDSQIRKAKGY